jgi:hypothetical protein
MVCNSVAELAPFCSLVYQVLYVFRTREVGMAWMFFGVPRGNFVCVFLCESVFSVGITCLKDTGLPQGCTRNHMANKPSWHAQRQRDFLLEVQFLNGKKKTRGHFDHSLPPFSASLLVLVFDLGFFNLRDKGANWEFVPLRVEVYSSLHRHLATTKGCYLCRMVLCMK